MKVDAFCGTRDCTRFEIELDDYDTYNPTSATVAEYDYAFKLLKDTLNDPDFANNGHRNHDAVNGCIALHVLGYDAESWFENFTAAQSNERFYQSDLDIFMQHVERVAKYLPKWGPVGNEGQALSYVI